MIVEKKTLLLARDNLNTIEVLMYKTLTDWYITYYKFVLVISILRENDIMEKAIKILRSQWFMECMKFMEFYSIYKAMLSY